MIIYLLPLLFTFKPKSSSKVVNHESLSCLICMCLLPIIVVPVVGWIQTSTPLPGLCLEMLNDSYRSGVWPIDDCFNQLTNRATEKSYRKNS